MTIPILEQRLGEITAAGHVPFFVAATAGTTVRGSYDPILPLLALREQYGFWLHVDGAWGGAALFSDRLRSQYLPHLEQADSFTLDFHKMLGTALMCNVLLFNYRPAILRDACSAGDESYIFREGPDGDVRDLGTLSLQCGRRVDSLKWFLDWKFYGKEGLAQRIENYLVLCRYAEERVQQSNALEMVVPRESFNICFRYRTPAHIPAGDFNRELRDRMHRQGENLVGTGFVNGELILRLLITNINIGKPEIDAFFEAVQTTGRKLLAERGGPEATSTTRST
jgi:glutamate/tyrosine decarboxylase-like PLP-dependent enzyme